MGMPATTKKSGDICFAFPDVCLTPAPSGPNVPIPYPNIGQLGDATGEATTVKIGGNPTIIENSKIGKTTGDEAGTGGGVTSGSTKGKVDFIGFSKTVKAEGGGIVRLGDTTKQNNQNAVGTVLGGEPTVLVGD